MAEKFDNPNYNPEAGMKYLATHFEMFKPEVVKAMIADAKRKGVKIPPVVEAKARKAGIINSVRNAKFKVGDEVVFKANGHRGEVKKIDGGKIGVRWAFSSSVEWHNEDELQKSANSVRNANARRVRVLKAERLVPDRLVGQIVEVVGGRGDDKFVKDPKFPHLNIPTLLKKGEYEVVNSVCSTNAVVAKAMAMNAVACNAAYSNTLNSILRSVKPYMDRRIKGDQSWEYPKQVSSVLRKVCDRAVMSAGRYDGKRPPHRVYIIECEKDGFKFMGNLIVTGLLHRDDPDDVSAFDEYDMTISLMYVGKALNAVANVTASPELRKAYDEYKKAEEKSAKRFSKIGGNWLKGNPAADTHTQKLRALSDLFFKETGKRPPNGFGSMSLEQMLQNTVRNV